jgi:phosphoglycolate phosphatase-like HAD superfamily hydrolase
MTTIRRLILFDIDGTLLVTGGAGFRAMARAGRELYAREIDWDSIDPSGGLDPLIFTEATRRSGIEPTAEEHTAFQELYVRLLPEELARHPERLRLMPGIPELLDGLRRQGDILLGLLTGNFERTARLKIEAAGLLWDAFAVGAFGDEAPTRPELVPVARARVEERYGRPVPPENLVIVGDTPKDVECARENGCRVLAVATGRHSVEELRAAGADRAVEELTDPRPLFELLEG